MFLDKYVIPVLQWLFMVGIPMLLIVVAIIVFLKIFVLPVFFSGRQKKERSSTARVVRKREEVLSNGSGVYSLYFVNFSVEDEGLEFSVTKNLYDVLSSGDKGKLVYEGDKLVDFVITEKSTKTETGESILVGDTMRSTLNIMPQRDR